MTNKVEVDDDALASEAAAAVANAPVDDMAPVAVDPAAPAAELVPADVESWGPFLSELLKFPLFGIVVPQWGVPEAQQVAWIDSLGKCMDQVLPGGPAGKYACWAQLLVGSMSIVGMTYIQNAGKFPPLGPKRPPEQQVVAAPVATSAA